MKGVLTSDWHLDVFTAGVDRYDDVCHSIDASVQAAIDMEASFYLMCGDLADPNTSRAHRAVAKAVEVQRRCVRHNIVPFFVAGNHDVIEDGSGVTTMTALARTELGYVFERPMMMQNPSHVFIALPFVEAAGDYDADEFIRKCVSDLMDDKQFPADRPVLIAGHLSLSGIHPGSETTDMARGRKTLWPTAAIRECFPQAMVVGGHYHKPQVYDGVNIIGSLAQLRFGEDIDELGYMTVEF